MAKNELDIVNQLLSNEKSAKAENKAKPHWGGDVLEISKEEKENAGLPLDSYIVVKQIPTPNCGATVYDPVYWMYGFGADTMSAVRDCLNNITAWRAKNLEYVPTLIAGWQERLKQYGHPTKSPLKMTDIPKKVKDFIHPIESVQTKAKANKTVEREEESVSDFLDELGL